MKRFEKITQLIPRLEGEKTHRKWVIDTKYKGTPDDPIQFPFVGYGEVAYELIHAVCGCVDENEDLDVRNYRDVLDSYGLDDDKAPQEADPSMCDGRCTLAMIPTIVRGDRIREGLLLEYLDNGLMLRWMKRLEEIDNQ